MAVFEPQAGGLKLLMDLQQMKRKQTRLMHAHLLSEEEAELLNFSLSNSAKLLDKASGKASAVGAAVRRRVPSASRYVKVPAAISPA